ncbi:MAG: exosortase/archaeosortase family protein [Kiritimatiellae bacterium]|nr:exosortase/archaeosortase family protein [Kiritimatiellia bacterium]
MTSKIDKAVAARLAMLGAAFIAVLWGFQAMLLHHAPSIFTNPQEDMGYGWYVPLFSIYVAWSERKKIWNALSAPGWGGLLILVPSVAVGFLGVRGLQVRMEIFAFVFVLLALVWTFFGRSAAKALLFPLLFLLFCIPLATFLDVVTVHLRIFASSTAYAVLKGFGADVVRQGTMIGAADGSFSIDIAEPCSGLRSIFALMALTAGYAYFNQPTWLRRGLLFACSVPIAILGNVFRILSICLVANYASTEFATGFYHDYSGYVIFIVAILLMIGAGEVLSRLFRNAKNSEEKGESREERPLSFARACTLPVLALAFLVPAMLYQAATPKTIVAEAPDVQLEEIEGFTSERVDISEAELTILPGDTRIDKRLYTAPNGDWFQVSLVIGGTSKSSIHRPELCLPAQGYLMTEPRTINVSGRDWRLLTVETHGAKIGFGYTFYNQEGYHTASHTSRILKDIWDRSILNRIDRWVMVTVNSSRADDDSLRDFIGNLKGAFAK